MDYMGIVQWFRFEEHEAVERAITLMHELGVRSLRTAFSWADWERPGGKEWLDWFVATFFRAGIDIFPVLFYTPAAQAFLLKGQSPKHARTSFPPAQALHYANFCEEMIRRYGDQTGDHFQLWNEWNNDAYWSPLHDPGFERFAQMVRLAIAICKQYGKRTVLGGIIPPYLPALETMRAAGVLDDVDEVSVHAFPGTWDKMPWKGWPSVIAEMRQAVPGKEIWVTETGFSTVTLEDHSAFTQARREIEQVAYFKTLFDSQADRVFWHCLFDQSPDHPTDNVLNRPDPKPADPRAYHFGLVDLSGRKKLLFDEWKSLVESNEEEMPWEKAA